MLHARRDSWTSFVLPLRYDAQWRRLTRQLSPPLTLIVLRVKDVRRGWCARVDAVGKTLGRGEGVGCEMGLDGEVGEREQTPLGIKIEVGGKGAVDSRRHSSGVVVCVCAVDARRRH